LEQINKPKIAAACWSSFTITSLLNLHMNIKIFVADEVGIQVTSECVSWWLRHNQPSVYYLHELHRFILDFTILTVLYSMYPC
jgi:hypothetical protein